MCDRSREQIIHTERIQYVTLRTVQTWIILIASYQVQGIFALSYKIEFRRREV